MNFIAIENQSAREARNREVTARTKPSGRRCTVARLHGCTVVRAGGMPDAGSDARALILKHAVFVWSHVVRVRSYAKVYANTFGPCNVHLAIAEYAKLLI